jgi:hypothetical protein
MDPNFKPYESGLLTVEERYPCGKSIGQRGRANVYYLCKCKCGKEFIVTGDELSKHPYSCGCTPKPKSWNGSHSNQYALGYGDKTMICMLKPGRHVYSNSKTGVAGVSFDPRRRHWVAKICFQQKTHFLGYFDSKEEAIAARVKGEHQYYDTYLANHKN